MRFPPCVRGGVAALCSATLVTLACSIGCASGPRGEPMPAIGESAILAPQAIAWEPARQERGSVAIPGSVHADFGRFELLWVVDARGDARLLTREPAGSGELPLREKQLWPLALEGGVTAVFQEWTPLANVKQPATVRMVVAVATADLFSVLADTAAPPGEPLPRVRASLRWGSMDEVSDVRRVRGLAADTALSWERRGASLPVLLDGTGTERLFPWSDEQAEISVLLQAVLPTARDGTPAHLVPLVAVSTRELLRGFDLVW